MKEVVYTVRVEFGDCDPARIVWFPNFFRWIDAASRHFFVECGVPHIVVSVQKPGALRFADSVGVTIERTTADFG